MERLSILCEPTRTSDPTPRPHFKRFITFCSSLEKNMDATRKAVVAIALAEYQALQNKYAIGHRQRYGILLKTSDMIVY